MKLRNKKTGEIPEKIETITYIQWSGKIMMVYINSDGARIMKHYDSLGDFNEEWQDYEEPKGIVSVRIGDLVPTTVFVNMATKEEAEKAVKKLRAWKRLRDKGFKFTGYNKGSISFRLNEEYSNYIYDGHYIDQCRVGYENDEVHKDLDLLFGGEE